MEQREKKIRNSNLEILRIISMVLVVAHHYSIHGFETIEMTYGLNRFVAGILSLGGKLGVACFILISGYFMVQSKFTLKKLLRLLTEVWFYSIVIGVISLLFLQPAKPVGLREIASILFPVGYWFITDYILLMLISPGLNLLISKMKKQVHLAVLLSAFVLWSVIPSFAAAELGYSDFGWFVILYFTAAYIRKYVNMEKRNAWKHFLVAILSYLIVIASNVLMIYFGNRWNMPGLMEQSIRFSELNSPFIFITAIELLIGFAKRKPFHNRIVNAVAGAALGVYLIHDNIIFRSSLWQGILKVPDMYQSEFLIVHALVSIALIYLVCTGIDLLRQITVEKVFVRAMDRHLEQVKKAVVNAGRWGAKKVRTALSWYYR